MRGEEQARDDAGGPKPESMMRPDRPHLGPSSSTGPAEGHTATYRQLGGVPMSESPVVAVADLPVLALDSDGPIQNEWLRVENRFRQRPAPRTDRPIRVDDASLLWPCPECGAPLTIRRWLSLADCWQCGACVALHRLHPLRSPASAPANAPSASPRAEAETPRANAPATIAPDPIVARRPRSGRIAPTVDHGPALLPAAPRARRPWTQWLGDAPAWLTSMLLHLVLLLLLALWSWRPDPYPEQITLSTAFGTEDREGGRVELPATDDAPSFDLPIPDDRGWEDPEQRAMLVQADQDARALRMDPDVPAPELPDLRSVRESIQQHDPSSLFLTRDPRVRVDMVQREGGTTLTEAAVARGLRWLAVHQEFDGSWRLRRFADHPDCGGRCGGRAQLVSDSAATALALLPFLGAGQTHETGLYRDVVARGLDWLVRQQGADGDLRGNSRGQPAMYAHGQATIVLSEAFAMTGDERLREPAQRAVDFIVNAQHPRGGWRYHPGEQGDTSVLGWQLMALQSARVAGLDVPYQTLVAAEEFLWEVSSHSGSRYRYQPRREPTHVMTAEALLCRLYLGWPHDDARLQRGLDWMVSRHPPRRDTPDIYYWYYATQTLHHVGGPMWDEWNRELREILVDLQCRQGHEAGSWDPVGPHSDAGGRIYMTSLAVCILEVYYRHAPIFRPLSQ